MHEDCLRQIAAYFIVTLYAPGDNIAYEGDVTRSMYFIHDGKVDVLETESDIIETTKNTLQRRDSFGLVSQLFNLTY